MALILHLKTQKKKCSIMKSQNRIIGKILIFLVNIILLRLLFLGSTISIISEYSVNYELKNNLYRFLLGKFIWSMIISIIAVLLLLLINHILSKVTQDKFYKRTRQFYLLEFIFFISFCIIVQWIVWIAPFYPSSL